MAKKWISRKFPTYARPHVGQTFLESTISPPSPPCCKRRARSGRLLFGLQAAFSPAENVVCCWSQSPSVWGFRRAGHAGRHGPGVSATRAPWPGGQCPAGRRGVEVPGMHIPVIMRHAGRRGVGGQSVALAWRSMPTNPAPDDDDLDDLDDLDGETKSPAP